MADEKKSESAALREIAQELLKTSEQLKKQAKKLLRTAKDLNEILRQNSSK
jgi:molybdenum-dependent DNA-binding transcriptional regulator ModE